MIGKYKRNIFREGELEKSLVWAKFSYTSPDGKYYQVDYYNLAVIISVGYRVKSLRGTQFRIWANNVLKEYMKKGFIMNDDLLKTMTEEFILINCWSGFVIFVHPKEYSGGKFLISTRQALIIIQEWKLQCCFFKQS